MQLNVKLLFSLFEDKISSCQQNKYNLHSFVLQLTHYIFLIYIFNILERNDIVYKNLIIKHFVVSFFFE